MEEDYKKNHNKQTLTDAQHSHILIVASIKIMGKVSIWADKHMGISTENKVGFERRQRKKEKELLKTNPQNPNTRTKGETAKHELLTPKN